MRNLWKVRRTARGVGLAVIGMLALSIATLVPDRAHAGNDIVVAADSLELLPNYNTVNFKLHYGGDDDQDASIAVMYWKTSEPALKDEGVDAMRWHSTGWRRTLAGKLFWLAESVSYTIELVVTDPDGGGTTITQSVTTLPAAGHGATGPQIWVSPSGNDINSGFNQSAPKRTIASAIAKITNENHPGAQIRLLPGKYYESNVITRSGTAAQPYSIVGHGNPDTIIIAGNDPALLNVHWSQYDSQYKIYRRNVGSTPVGLVVAGWGQRLHTKSHIDSLRFPAPNMPQQGWYRSGNYVYVRLENNANPNQTTMHVGIHTWGLRFLADYWRAESLTVRFVGNQTGPSDGFHLGEWNTAVKEITIRNCKFWTNAGKAIYGNRFTSDVLVDLCEMEDGRVGTWGYFAGKGHPEEGCEGLSMNGRRWILRNSVIRNVFNGVGVWGGEFETKWGSASDFHDNTIEVADDGLEFDCGQGQNLAVWGNFIRTGANGVSLVPTQQGPVYVMYNVFARCWEGSHKQGSIGGSGACGIPGDATGYFYHNTSFSDATNPFHVTYNSRGAHKNRRYLNNIMMGSTNGPVVGDHANGGVTSTCSFDYDLLWRQSANNLWHWGGIQYNTLAEVQSTFGWELHGKNEQPLFVNAAQNDFRPTASSPSVDMGTLIRGINTPFKTQVNCQRRYCDVPDAGAFEYGTCSSGGCDLTPPAPSPMFNVWGGCEHIYVSWLSTGDDGNVGTATAYDLRWSDSPITTDAEFDLASPAPGPLPTPAAPGNLENYSVYLGNCGPHKYFALRIVDDFGNKSSLIFEANGAQPACIAPPEICAE